MGLYGPYTAVAGAVQQCPVDPSAQAVYIRNTTIYDLAVSFKMSPPSAVVAFGAGDWFTIVPNGDRVGVPIPADLYGSSGFPGYIWILPINNTTSMPLPGTSASNALFWLEGYPSLAALPGSYASPQFQNLASQPRIVSMDPVPFYSLKGSWNQATNPLDLFPGPWSPVLVPSNFTLGTNFKLTAYLDYAYICPYSTTTNPQLVVIQLVTKNAGGTVLDTIELARGVCACVGVTTGQEGQPFQIQRRQGVTFSPNAAATSSAIRLFLSAGTAIGSVAYHVSFDVDWWNQQTVPYIGGGAGGRIDMQTGYPPSGVGLVPPLF